MTVIEHDTLDLTVSELKTLLFPCLDIHTKCTLLPSYFPPFNICPLYLSYVILPVLLCTDTLQSAFQNASFNPQAML